MSNYIEREEIDNTIADCSNDIPPSKNKQMEEENIARWSWLINEWEDMTFMERMSLFMPYHHYMNLRNSWKREFDAVIEAELVAVAFMKCRSFKELKFDPDGQGIPNLILVYNPIDVNMIPDAKIKASVKDWATKFGFIESSSSKCCRYSD